MNILTIPTYSEDPAGLEKLSLSLSLSLFSLSLSHTHTHTVTRTVRHTHSLSLFFSLQLEYELDITQHGDNSYRHHDNYHGHSASHPYHHSNKSWSWGGILGLAVAGFILYQCLKGCFSGQQRYVCVCVCVCVCVRALIHKFTLSTGKG